MKKSDVVKKVAKMAGLTQRQTAAVFTAIEELMHANAATGEPTCIGPVTATVVSRKSRTGFNPLNNQPIEIPARNHVKLKASAGLKKAAVVAGGAA